LWSKGWHAFDGLATDTLWSGAHDFIQLVTAFTSFYLLQRSLALESYGAYIGLYGLLGALGAVSYAGVGLALLQRLLGERDDPDETLRSFLSAALLIGVAASVIGTVVAALVLSLTTIEIMLVVVAELVGVAIVFVSAMLVQASSGFPAATRIKMVVIVLRLLVVSVLAAVDQLTIRNLASGFLITFLLYAAYLLLVHLPRHGYRVSVGRPTSVAWRSSVMFSAPMGASRLQTDADKFLLNAFRYDADAGLYGAAYRLVLLGTLPLLALDTAAFQRFLPRAEGQAGVHWRRATRLAALMAVASTLVALALYLLLPFFDFLFAAEYKEAVDIVPWLLLLIPLIATSNTPMNGLLGLGRADKRMLVYLSSAAVSLVLYFLLIPPFSWQGAVVATVISELYLSISGWVALWYYQRRADRELDDDPIDPVMSSA
jgi:O-antigen/teichoic acid export membrane protein